MKRLEGGGTLSGIHTSWIHYKFPWCWVVAAGLPTVGVASFMLSLSIPCLLWVMEVLTTKNNNVKHMHCRVKEEVLLSRRAPQEN